MDFSGKFLENLLHPYGRYFMTVQGRSDNPSLPTRKVPKPRFANNDNLHRVSSVIQCQLLLGS